MRIADFNRLQDALWNQPAISEPVDLLDAADVVTWSGRAIEVVPSDVNAPGTTLARRRVQVRRLAFRESSTPALARGQRLRWRGVVEVVDGTPAVEHEVVTVALG